ncbi:MAG: ABC-ATPase UvrA [Cryomorphaceae bacterium BACL21 MAG-121220-bin10]|jgi:excinuclease ABC subunit A|nr:MAG: ABC-ATPase UvrA [Cryomorphaceae bacterium BACL21 MAG-121220-bin10]|tara:strand:- start:28989 stop:31766 length:2778 start_codon:yes stop_codon:yes gene_type:complete
MTRKATMASDSILIQGAKLHNLKNITVALPRHQLIVITGLSGSGKSSLAFDTLYAEGQRRYVESLSSYARQFLGRLDKPKVDSIKGIAPAIAIEQRVNATNPRSTVGTSTEIYDYLKLLFARIGKTYSPVSGQKVKKDTVTDVIDAVVAMEPGTRLLLLAPIILEKGRALKEKINTLAQQGFSRIKHQGEIKRIDDNLDITDTADLFIVIDRIVTAEDEDFLNRLADAIQIAFFEGKGTLILERVDIPGTSFFSNRFERDGMSFVEPNVHLFSFNNPFGACPTCEGYGDIVGIDPELVVPNATLSVYDNAIFPWRGESMSFYRDQLVNSAYKFDFPIHKPFFELTEAQKRLIWQGNEHFIGLQEFFDQLEAKNYKIQNRVMLSRYRGKTLCTTCEGARLKQDAAYVKIQGYSIQDLVKKPLDELKETFSMLTLDPYDTQVSKRLLVEINNRLNFLNNVGLGYLTLNRKSNTLSGGESQRINLATSLASSLVGSMYILDEPSIGLHSKDTERLIEVLRALRDIGNTVIVVEHDEEIMRAADHIIDIGPEAGTFGGEVMAEGPFETILKSKSLTAQYLSGARRIEVPSKRRHSDYPISIIGARQHNLKNVDAHFPLGVFTVVTGVSGSGKTTLVKSILYPALLRKVTGYGDKPGAYSELTGATDRIKNVEFVDQNPIGRSSRSNPVTYIKAYDDIRNLFARQKLSNLRGYKAKHFSFNVDGGRCDTCKGEGEVTIEMQFMADVHLICEACSGKRFKREILEVRFHEKSIFDVLSMTVDEAIAFFDTQQEHKIITKLRPLQDVGLGYVQLGQSSSTLSGGEAQRIKLASFLVKGDTKEKTFFIFDEPTTGLHFHDIQKLLASFYALLEKGHTIVVVEHNLELIKCADHVIDLGPEGGQKGGQIVAQGTPEEIAQSVGSFTGQYLKDKI